MKARKQRVVIEAHADQPITERQARQGVSLLFDRLGDGHWRRRWLRPWVSGKPRLRIGDAKQFSSVLASEKRKEAP